MPIVEAVGSAAAAGNDEALARRIESAMAEAVRVALSEGIPMSNVDEYRARQLAAADRVVEEHHKLSEAIAVVSALGDQ